MFKESEEYPWILGRVPNGFWDARENRVRYMDWLAQRYSFNHPEDWYAVSKSYFKNNRGGGLLTTKYQDSLCAALKDYYPEFEWLPWKFRRTRNKFWSSADNRRQYMIWLEGELGITEIDQWYRVTKQTFKKHHGAGLLYGCYGDSVLAAVREHHPDHPWHPWLFNESPHRFWHEATNRRAYMSWLGEKLGYKSPEDWHAITTKDFHENKGAGFLSICYGDSPQKAVREYLPDLPEAPWLFSSVPQHYWHDAENRMSYLKWLGEKLGFRTSSDWFRLSSADFHKKRGRGLLDFYTSRAIGKAIAEALRENGNHKIVVWPIIQLIECSSSSKDTQKLFLALST